MKLNAKKFTSSMSQQLRKGAFFKTNPENLRKIFFALEKTSKFLAVESDINTILSKIASSIGKALGAKYVNFWDFTPDKKAVYIIAAYGMQKQYSQYSIKDPIELGTMWVGKAMKYGQAFATYDLPNDPNLPPPWLPAVKKQGVRGLVCIPLKRKNEIIGGMCIYYKGVHEFTYFEMSIATIVANQAATAVANTRLFNDLLSEKNKTVATLQSLKDGLIIYDMDGKILLFNHRAEEILNLKALEVVGKSVNADDIAKGPGWANLFKIKSLVQMDFTSQEFELPKPQAKVLDISYLPVREQYRKIGAMQILRDITKEKEAEKLKYNFISIASHQLRTPLTELKWGLSSLAGGDFGALNTKQSGVISKTARITEYMINLVNDLLDVSKLEEGGFDFNMVKGDLVKITREVFDQLKYSAAKRELKFTLEEPVEKLPEFKFDAQRLTIAIGNVLANAVNYTLPKGFVRIKFKVDNQRKFVFLIVEDSGIGIPDAEQKFIFSKFYRAKNAVKIHTDGSGLGLYIASEVMKKHSGQLYFTSKENKGSTFYLQFPV